MMASRLSTWLPTSSFYSFLVAAPVSIIVKQLTTKSYGRQDASVALLMEVCPEVEVLNNAEPHHADLGTDVMGWMVQ